MTALDTPAVAAGSVWATGQDTPAVQRRGRYVPESMAHPAKMLPAVAAHAITTYTQPGELVLDPMCGIGTTLVEALHQDRRAIGVEYEARWAEIARANIAHTGPAPPRTAGRCTPGTPGTWTGSSRPSCTVRSRSWSPHRPYGPSTHGRVTTDHTGVHKTPPPATGTCSTAGTWPTSATTGCWPGSPASSPSPPRSCAPAAGS